MQVTLLDVLQALQMYRLEEDFLLGFFYMKTKNKTEH